MATMEAKVGGAASRASLPGVQDEKLGVIAPVDRVNAWLEVAAPGDRLNYAVRPWLPAGHPTAALLRNLQAQGLVNLFQKRSDLFAGEFAYFAERTTRGVSQAVREEARAVLAARRDDSGDHALADRLLPLLTRAAQFGRPCPTDKYLASRLQVHPDSMPAAFTALRARRDIVVHPAPAPTLRRVVILSTGARTGIVA